jgi:small nuclear ribonucleoprotein (snRNP)-like protein
LHNNYKKILFGKKVIINLKTDKAFRGYLVEAKGVLIELKNSELLEPGLEPVSVKGSIFIERDNIDFIQVSEE